MRVTYLIFVLQLIWVLFLLAVTIYKFIDHGPISVIEHFTNWSWILQLVFYALTLPYLFSLRFAVGAINFLFFPVLGVIWVVAVGVNVLLATDSDFVTHHFQEIQPGIVIIGNDLYHTYPLIAILIYIFLQRRLILSATVELYTHPSLQGSWVLQLAVASFQVLFGPLVYLLAYLVIFDARMIYDTEFEEIIGLIGAVVVLLIFNALPFVVFFFAQGVNDRTRRKLFVDNEDFVYFTGYERELDRRSAEAVEKRTPSAAVVRMSKFDRMQNPESLNVEF